MALRTTFLRFLKKSFFIRILMLMLLVSVLPLIGLAYLSMQAFSDTFEKEVNKLNYQVVAQMNERIDLTMTRLQQLSFHYALLAPIENALQSPSHTFADFVRKKELITTLESGIAVMGDVQSLSLYLRSEEHIISTYESYMQISESAYYPMLNHYIAAREPFMFYDLDRLEAAPQLLKQSSFFLRKIPVGSEDDFEGVLIFSISNKQFDNLLKNIHTDTSAAAYVLTPGLNIVATNNTWPDEEKRMRLESTLREWHEQGEPKQFQHDGALISIQQSETFHRWIVLSEIPLKEALSNTAMIKRTVSVMLLCMITIGLIITICVGYYLYKPLQSVKRQLHMIKQGRWDVRVPIRVNNEIGELGEMLHATADTLQSLVQELRKTESLKRRNEIRALQSQINPHFIYNSLNTITMFAMLKDYAKIKEMMTRLTSLLRYSMENMEQTASIQQEIDYLQDYIHMLQLRYDCQLNLQVVIEPEYREKLIPKLLLQPLIENAIFHGILAKETNAGTITLHIHTAKEHPQLMELIVADDGAGMSAQRLQQMESQLMNAGSDDNIGLKNVWERIKLFYGPQCEIALSSEPMKGTIITMTIPKEKESVHSEEDI
ncbi:histidine kinase [Paenibacillus sp. GCM10027626]|uniref:sensor histidine kinase n=1 Tax=Paenibacillus sp. GCM10027626 TaxID=3273411 RepID=UPI00363408A7